MLDGRAVQHCARRSALLWSSHFQPLAMGVVQALGLSPEMYLALTCAQEGDWPFCMWNVMPNVQQSSVQEAPQSAVGCKEPAWPPSEGLLIFVPLSWTFLPDSGLAPHPGQADSIPVLACGHHDAAHHGERALSVVREVPAPAPVGTVPAMLGGSRYWLIREESGFSSP